MQLQEELTEQILFLHQEHQLLQQQLAAELAVITPTELHQHVDQEHLEDRVVAKEQLLVESLDPLQEQELLVKVIMVEQDKDNQVLLNTQVEVVVELEQLEETPLLLMLLEQVELV
jgi:hypothetical protein